MNHTTNAAHGPAPYDPDIDRLEAKALILEPGVDASLLYPFRPIKAMSSVEWIDSLREKRLRAEPDSPLRMMRGPDGRYFLNFDFAATLAWDTKPDLLGAILRIVLDEARFEIGCPDYVNPTGYANAMLKRLGALASDDNWVPAVVLHIFLEEEFCFEWWISLLSETFEMVCERDYKGDGFHGQYDGGWIPEDSVVDFDLWFSPAFATRAAMENPSRRGALIRMLLGDTPVSESTSQI